MIEVGDEMPVCDSPRTLVIAPAVVIRQTPWPRAPNAPRVATNQRLPSGPAAIEVEMASSPIGKRASWPEGDTRSISARLAIHTLRSGPAVSPPGRKPRTGGRSLNVAMSETAPEAEIAQTWVLESNPNPTTQTRPSGPAAIACPRAAAPEIANSVTKPAGVIRPTTPVP